MLDVANVRCGAFRARSWKASGVLLAFNGRDGAIRDIVVSWSLPLVEIRRQ